MKKKLLAILAAAVMLSSLGIPAVFASPEETWDPTPCYSKHSDENLSFLRELGVLSDEEEYDCCRTRVYPELVLDALCAMFCEETCEGHEPFEGTANDVCTVGRFSRYFWQINNTVLYADERFGQDYVAYAYLKPYDVVSTKKSTNTWMKLGDLNDTLKNISEAKNVQWTFNAPELMNRYNIKIDSHFLPGAFFREFMRIPDELLKDWEESGYTMYFGDSWYEGSGFTKETAGGICNYAERYVGIHLPSAVVHEMGHFMHWWHGSYYKTYHLYADRFTAREVLGDYACTNHAEWYAEFFEYWIYNQYDTEAMEVLKKAAPQTYSYFEQKAQRNWAY